MEHTGSLPPSPNGILDAMLGFQVTAALKGAIDLDIFTEIANGADTSATLANACQASEKGMRVLCDFLTVRGFLIKSDGRYSLTPDSAAFLSKASPTYLGSVSHFMNSNEIMRGFTDVASLVRKGGTLNVENGLAPEHPMWVEFARSMVPMMMLPASLLAKHVGGEPVKKILDIAAGHGMYGVLLAMENPGARLVALDWPNVLELAKENAQKFGVSDRFEMLPGSAFEVDFGTGYDIVLLPNFLHHFSKSVNVDLLRKVKAALNAGGRVALCEFVPNDDRVSPPFPAMFSFMMLGNTPEGDAYTEAELREMLVEAGFANVERTDLAPSPATLIVARR